MCGRAAQTASIVTIASTVLQTASGLPFVEHQSTASSRTSTGNSENFDQSVLDGTNYDSKQLSDYINYNMSPGMDAIVFWKDKATNEIHFGQKLWGLVPRGGTATAPLPEGMNKHFEGLMFNARTDTLYQKSTFSRLAQNGKSCLVAMNGFFEWKAEVKGKKQPYFVYSKESRGDTARPYLLMTGLWTSVPTGNPDKPTLDTFTLMTTDVCKPLDWLHTRMPVTVWDEKLALQWLDCPSENLLHQIDEGARQTPDGYFDWHAVTPEMSSMKFRTIDAIKPLPKMKTVKSFFTVATSPSKDVPKNNSASKISSSKVPNLAQQKRSITEVAGTSSPPTKTNQSTPNKKPKTGTIQSFFKPKK